MEIVLGVSMTPTTVRMALVEGEKADGVIIEQDFFDITAIDGSATSSVAEDVVAAILGTQEGAIGHGHRLISTGVTWSDDAQAAALRKALEAHGIEDVLLVSELHAAGALAQAVGRAVGYDTTALTFVSGDAATLAVVETAEGSVMRVIGRSQSLHDADAIAVMAEMVASLEAEGSAPQGLFVVGSNVDVTEVKTHLQDLVSVPVMAPMEPQLALPRGAALASASAPRFDTSTIGLAYSQELGATIFDPVAPVDTVTEFDAQAGRKPFALAGSALAAVFAVGVALLAITMAVNHRPTAEGASDALRVPPSALVPPSAIPGTNPVAPQPVPERASAPPPDAAVATARMLVPPAPPPQRVVVRNAAPAPAAPPPPPPPPNAVLPVVIPWLPKILIPPPHIAGPVPGPWSRGGGHRGGHGGGHRGGHGGD